MVPFSTFSLLAAITDLVNSRSIARVRHHWIFERDAILLNTEGCPADTPLCSGGGCTNNLIGLDLLNCGGDGIECKPSQLCIGGSCQDITLTDPGSPTCSDTCSTGQFCGNNGSCEALQLNFDPLRCGEAMEVCDTGSLCINSR